MQASARKQQSAPSEAERFAIVATIARGELTVEEAARKLGAATEDIEAWVDDLVVSAKSALDQRLRGSLARRGLGGDAHPDQTEFSGTIEDVAVCELIQMLELGRRCASIVIRVQGSSYHLRLEKGQIVDAQSPSFTGSEAVYRAIALQSGSFSVRFGTPPSRTVTVEDDTQRVVMEGVRRIDEMNHVLDELPHCEQVLLAQPLLEGQLSFEAEALAEIFGDGSTISEARRLSSVGELDTVLAIRDLWQDGHLKDTGERRSEPDFDELAAQGVVRSFISAAMKTSSLQVAARASVAPAAEITPTLRVRRHPQPRRWVVAACIAVGTGFATFGALELAVASVVESQPARTTSRWRGPSE